MLQWNLQVSQRFSAMFDLELERLIVEVKRNFPDAVYRMVQGQLRYRGYSIQRQRITSSLARVDPDGMQKDGQELYRGDSTRFAVPTHFGLWTAITS